MENNVVRSNVWTKEQKAIISHYVKYAKEHNKTLTWAFKKAANKINRTPGRVKRTHRAAGWQWYNVVKPEEEVKPTAPKVADAREDKPVPPAPPETSVKEKKVHVEDLSVQEVVQMAKRTQEAERRTVEAEKQAEITEKILSNALEHIRKIRGA